MYNPVPKAKIRSKILIWISIMAVVMGSPNTIFYYGDRLAGYSLNICSGVVELGQ